MLRWREPSGLKESLYVLHSTIIVCILFIYILIRLVVTRVYAYVKFIKLYT